MRKTLVASVALVIAAVSAAAYAQGGHHHHMRPYTAELWQLGLTPTEVSQIQQIYQSNRGVLKPQFTALHQARMAYVTAVPGTPAFQSAQAALAQAASNAATAAVNQDANLRAQIFGVLSVPQQTELETLISQHAANHHMHAAGESSWSGG
jgi:Spy/CpxP family protein refolding chaperone